MSRWGDGIYEGDVPLDYLSTITYRLECELAWLLAPEQVNSNSSWLVHVLSLIELMLLFEQHYFSSCVFLMDREQAVRRWRDVILNVWDENWHGETINSFDAHVEQLAYRQRHRMVISAMFDRLESITHYWDDKDESILLPLSKEHPLPYFSVIRWVDQHGIKHVGAMAFVHDFAESLVKDIIYGLSAERRWFTDIAYGAPIYVAVDLLGFLCETYDISPSLDEQTVRDWRDKTLEFASEEPPVLIGNITEVFNRLERIARKHPKKFF